MVTMALSESHLPFFFEFHGTFFLGVSERGSWFRWERVSGWRMTGVIISRYFLVPSFLPVTNVKILYKTDQWGFGLGWLYYLYI